MTTIRAGLAAVTLAALPWIAAPAAAAEAPWCAVMPLGMGDVYWDCRYASLEACRPNVLSGNRGGCQLNPRYAEPPRHRVRIVRPR